MYTSPFNSYPHAGTSATVTSRISGGSSDHEPLEPLEKGPPVYARTESTGTSDSGPAAAADSPHPVISAEGQAAIDKSRQALEACVRRPNMLAGPRPDLSHFRMMTDHLGNLVQYGFTTDRVELSKSLNFLQGTYGFAPDQRVKALKTMQSHFNFALSEEADKRTILCSLQDHTTARCHDFINFSRSLRAAMPSKLWNDDAMQTLQSAAVRYLDQGGDLKGIAPSHASAFFQMLLTDHVQGVSPRDRRALEVMLTGDPGYVERIPEDGDHESLQEVAVPAAGEAEPVERLASPLLFDASAQGIDAAAPLGGFGYPSSGLVAPGAHDGQSFPVLTVFPYEEDERPTMLVDLERDPWLSSTAARSTPPSSPDPVGQERQDGAPFAGSVFASSFGSDGWRSVPGTWQEPGLPFLHRQEIRQGASAEDAGLPNWLPEFLGDRTL